MGDRLTRIVIVALLLVVGVYIAQPYFDRLLFSASTSRTVEPRGALADIERTSIELFERASPSVVQVVGARAGGLDPYAFDSVANNLEGFRRRDDLPRATVIAHIVGTGLQRDVE